MSADHSLFINCGGNKTQWERNEYEEDTNEEGASYFYSDSSEKWAYSSAGEFVGRKGADYLAINDNITEEIYRTARLAPSSLRYYGLCLQKGSYKVRLHFAEIQYSGDNTFSSIGRRIFDVSIQVSRSYICLQLISLIDTYVKFHTAGNLVIIFLFQK